MTKKLLTLTAVLILIGCFNSSGFSGQLAPELRDFILQTNPDGYTPVIILLSDRVDTKEIVESMTASKATLAKRHEVVVTELRNKADRTQGAVIDKIETLKISGGVKDYTPLWISNMIGMTAKLSAIDEIAALPEVEGIFYDVEIELIKPVDESPDKPGGTIQSVETGLEAIRADEVWAMGITGLGVLVSSLDTGVDGNHSAVYDRWRGHDPRYQNNPEWAWHDPLTYTTFPFDAGSHGTHTMGTVCGRSTTSDDTIGVAIDAEWISAGVIDRGGDLPTRMLRYLIAFQWTMDPDSNPATNWDVPAVCSNSWGHSPGSMPGGDCDDWYWETLSNMEAAGVCVVFAAGNEGNIGLRNPAVRATDDYNSFSVGAVDGNNPSYPIASFSSRGPSYCTPDSSAAIKPEVSAPGVSVRSSVPGNSYSTMSGTSMACPHVGGVVALIKQANPNLPPEMVKQIIYDTAYDLGPTGEDNDYGWGIIDAYEAVLLALSYLDGYGVVQGRVTDLVTGDGLQGRVIITNRVPQIVANCNIEGYYTLYAPSDSLWEFRAEYTEDYLPSFAQVIIPEDDTIYQDFQLEPKVEIVLKASFGNPGDISYRTFYFRGSWDDDGFYNAGWPSSFFPMRDDGVTPDEVAGDGVFTGSMKLATDLNNTYDWGVFSENYNNFASALQMGASFQITNPGNPPVVPELYVNPSGGEHNWTLTMHDENTGLGFDLIPGYNNQPHVWYGTIFIPGGLTADYIVKVMHSDVASYGQGGVGGDPISFTTGESGNYTFYFNDSSDVASTGAELTIMPGWFDVDIEPGQTATREITLTNEGEIDLYFEISEDVDSRSNRRYEPELPSYSSYNPPAQKTMNEIVPTGPPVIMGQGGPDAFGYTWIDSDEPNGPEFNWIDISGIGTPIDFGSDIDDGNSGPLPMGFDFMFYGNAFNSINVCTNGWSSFTDSTSVEWGNQPIPDPEAPNNILAAFFDDLNFENGGTGYYYTNNSDTGIVTWDHVPDWRQEGIFTFQIILVAPAKIVYQYLELGPGRMDENSIGIEDESGAIGLQIANDQNYAHNDLAVKIAAGWMDVMPASGIIPAGGDEVVTVTFDAADLILGDYTGSIYISSWDAIRQLPVMEVPVELHVIDYIPVLQLSMYPDNPPVQVPAGGSFDFGLAVTNNTQIGGVYEGWTMVELPNHNLIGPIVRGSNSIDPGETQYYHAAQSVPNFAPAGNYAYYSYVGSYPAIVIDEASFPFEILSYSLNGESADSWSVIGLFTNPTVAAGENVPSDYSLSQNYPNPFNARSIINYSLAGDGHVELTVFNLLGQKVETLIDGYQQAGYNSVSWDASHYSSGIYFYKLTAGDKVFTKRMTLVK